MGNFLSEFDELVLLAILKLGKDAYGVPIANLIEEVTEKSVSTGTLHAAFARLEDKGFIKSWMGEATKERGGRAKKYFAVEISGKEAIKNSAEIRNQLSADIAFA